MQKREMNATPLDSLSMLVSAYGVLDIVFKYGVETRRHSAHTSSFQLL